MPANRAPAPQSAEPVYDAPAPQMSAQQDAFFEEPPAQSVPGPDFGGPGNFSFMFEDGEQAHQNTTHDFFNMSAEEPAQDDGTSFFLNFE